MALIWPIFPLFLGFVQKPLTIRSIDLLSERERKGKHSYKLFLIRRVTGGVQTILTCMRASINPEWLTKIQAGILVSMVGKSDALCRIPKFKQSFVLPSVKIQILEKFLNSSKLVELSSHAGLIWLTSVSQDLRKTRSSSAGEWSDCFASGFSSSLWVAQSEMFKCGEF